MTLNEEMILCKIKLQKEIEQTKYLTTAVGSYCKSGNTT